MDTLYWNIFVFISLFSTNPTSGQSEVEVHLRLKKYVERGSSVTIFCEHNVKQDILYKVLWLKADNGKLLEYVRVRDSPFRNFSIPGAEIDWSKTDETKLSLHKLDFNASGHYYCEVSTDTPIFTKASQEEPLHVISPQSGPPAIKFKKKPPFYIGDQLTALCNTTVARPIPHITWLINGKKVPNEYLRPVNMASKNTRNKPTPKKPQHMLNGPQSAQNHHQPSAHTQHTSKHNPAYLDRNGQVHLHHGGSNNHHNNMGDVDDEIGNINNNNEKLPSLRGSNPHGFDSNRALGNLRMTHHGQHRHVANGEGDPNMRSTSIYNAYSHHANEHATNHRPSYDNKYYELRKHRNLFNRKYRRYLNSNNNHSYKNMRRSGGLGGVGEFGGSIGDYGNGSLINDAAYSIQATINNGAISVSSNSEGSGYGGGFLPTGSIGSSSIGSGGGSISGGNSNVLLSHANDASKYHSHIPYNGTYAMSGILIQIAEHHINSNGRLEITCLATIPAHVAPGEQYADYKTHSVKIDVERRPNPLPNKTVLDPIPQVPDGLAQLANNNSLISASITNVLPINLIISCLTILRA